jgi:hypothetical protein
LPTLEESMKMIGELVKAKGFEHDFKDNVIFGKGLFALIEIAEAIDLIKKHGIETLKVDKYLRDCISEELIDALFYILDAYGILVENGVANSPDEVFLKKLAKNMNREFQYGRPIIKENK